MSEEAFERERLERQLETKADAIISGLLALIDGRSDVLRLPGGWRVRLDGRDSGQ